MSQSTAPAASPSPQKKIPLFIPHRDYPRPAAKTWLERASKHFGLEKPLNGGSPWIPLTAIEGFLVLGHSDPGAPLGDIPEALTIRVRLRPKDYESLKDRCMEHLLGFQNSKTTLHSAWTQFVDVSKRANPALRPHLAALQFLIDNGLSPRATGAVAVRDFLNEHKAVEWLVKAMAARQPILPTEDLKPNELPSGRLPDDVISRYKAVCYEVEAETIYILLPAGTNPTTFRTEVTAQNQSEGKLELAFGDPDALGRFVDNKVMQTVHSRDDVSRLSATDDKIFVCDTSLLNSQVKALDQPLEVLQWVLGQALATNATDIHMEAQDAQLASVRLRINGVLKVFGYITVEMLRPVISVAKIRCHCDSMVVNKPQDGKFKIKANDREADIRLNTIPIEKNGSSEAMALRILGRVRIPSIDSLGMTTRQIDQTRWINGRDHGLFLVTGPTGSGKTTTLNCMMKEIASPEICVVTIEDPVELPLPWVKQSQVNNHKEIGYDFNTALSSFLRQDPDVMMVGEVRDAKTADMVMQSALTGHLVFATLHTNSALMSVIRLRDLGIDISLIAETVIGVQAQRLVRTLCNSCRVEVKTPEPQKDYVRRYCQRVRKNLSDEPNCTDAHEMLTSLEGWLENGVTYRHEGCTACNGTGFDKSRAVMEIYIFQGDHEVCDMLLENKPISAIQKHFARNGHLDLASQMIRVFARHETSFKEIECHLPLL